MALSVSIPGWGNLYIANVLFDLNGTLARDGIIAESTRERLQVLSEHLSLYVMSADTHGTLDQVTKGLPVQVQRVQQTPGAIEKRDFLARLGAAQTAAVGNGRNDVEMLSAAALGIVILGPEGAAAVALQSAALVFGHIDDALDALIYPARLVATLRG
jgi:soluble P-type ATPase